MGQFLTVSYLLLNSRAHWSSNNLSPTKSCPLMISRRNKSDPAHWFEPKLATKLESRSAVEKWSDLHQQIVSRGGRVLDWLNHRSTVVRGRRELLLTPLCPTELALGGLWSWNSPALDCGASGVQISLVLIPHRSAFIRENTWQVAAPAFLPWSYI